MGITTSRITINTTETTMRGGRVYFFRLLLLTFGWLLKIFFIRLSGSFLSGFSRFSGFRRTYKLGFAHYSNAKSSETGLNKSVKIRSAPLFIHIDTGNGALRHRHSAKGYQHARGLSLKYMGEAIRTANSAALMDFLFLIGSLTANPDGCIIQRKVFKINCRFAL